MQNRVSYEDYCERRIADQAVVIARLEAENTRLKGENIANVERSSEQIVRLKQQLTDAEAQLAQAQARAEITNAMVPHVQALRKLYWYTVKSPNGAQVEFNALWTLLDMLPTENPPSQGCHAGQDGDCIWAECPQLRDGEPVKSGRHCPLDRPSDER